MKSRPVIINQTTLRPDASFDKEDSYCGTILATRTENRNLLDLAGVESLCGARPDQVRRQQDERSNASTCMGTSARTNPGRETSPSLLRQPPLREPRSPEDWDSEGEYPRLAPARARFCLAAHQRSPQGALSRGTFLGTRNQDRNVLGLDRTEERQGLRQTGNERRHFNAGSPILLDAGSWTSGNAARPSQVRQPSVCESGPFVSWKLHNQWSGQGSEGATVERGYVFGGNPHRRPSSSNSSEVRTS